MTTHKPATPLPWKQGSNLSPEFICGTHGDGHNVPIAGMQTFREGYATDAAYIAHACNSYPRLVEALRQAKAASTSAYLRGADFNNNSASAKAREVGAEMRSYAAELGNDIESVLRDIGEL